VFALLRRFRPAPDTIERPEQQRIQRAKDEEDPDRSEDATATEYLYVPSVIMQWMFPVVIVLAAYLFLRGMRPDAPGRGIVWWRPPTAAIEALDRLLARGRAA